MAYGLNFIADEDLFAHTAETVGKYRFQINLADLNHNLLDPVKLTFDSVVYHGACSNDVLAQVLTDEAKRQIDKSNTNHIGYFHQNIFRYIGGADGWEVPAKGWDVQNCARQIYVEMKNKHNTMNSSSSAKTYMRMQNHVLHHRDAVCMLVEVIARHSQDTVWTCTVNGGQMGHEQIRRISIDKFYEIVTGQADAFMCLCRVLPRVIADVVEAQGRRLLENTAVDELLQRNQAENLLKNLYLLAFRTYQGFDGFDLDLGGR